MSERLATKGRTLLYGLIIISVLLAATAQILLKHGMTQVTDHGAIPLALNRPVATLRRIAESLSRGVTKYIGGLSGVKVASRMVKSAGQ